MWFITLNYYNSLDSPGNKLAYQPGTISCALTSSQTLSQSLINSMNNTLTFEQSSIAWQLFFTIFFLFIFNTLEQGLANYSHRKKSDLPPVFFFFLINFTGIQLTQKIVLVSGIQQSKSVNLPIHNKNQERLALQLSIGTLFKSHCFIMIFISVLSFSKVQAT